MLTRPLVVLVTPPDHLSPELESYARGIISPKDRRKFGKWEERTISYFAGRAALRRGLEELKVKGLVAPDPEYGYLKLETDPPLFGNISHTGGLVAAVIAKQPVGIDVEFRTRDASRVLRRVATFKERNEWDSPISLWSAKEAFSKAFGLGIRFGLQGFEVQYAPQPPWKGTTALKGPLHVSDPLVWQQREQQFLVSVVTEAEALKAGIDLLRWSDPPFT